MRKWTNGEGFLASETYGTSLALLVMLLLQAIRHPKQPSVHTPSDTNGASEVTILARLLGNEEGELPPTMARYLLDLGFSAR